MACAVAMTADQAIRGARGPAAKRGGYPGACKCVFFEGKYLRKAKVQKPNQPEYEEQQFHYLKLRS